jgi:beta-galactosidase
MTTFQKPLEVNASDGMVILEFRPTEGDAIVSAIEVQ